MNICFYVDDFSASGGIQRVLSIVSSELSKHCNVHVVSMYNLYGDNNRELYNPNVKIHVLINGPKLYLKQCFKAAGLLRSYLKNNDIDILVESSEMLSPYCLLATKLSKTKLCTWTHPPAFVKSEALVQGPFKWLALKFSDCTIALTPETEKDLKTIYHTNKVINIPNPIDPRLLGPNSYNSKSKKIITVSRLSPEKNLLKLIDVAEILFKNNSEWTWDIYGDGIQKEELTNEILKRGLSDRLILKGHSGNIYQEYKNYSFLVMTSKYEGFPMVLLEGMANALPLVSFDIKTGPNILIDNEINGFLSKPYDENEMAGHILKLINDGNLRIEMSAQSERKINDFKIDEIINKWLMLFRTMHK